MSEQLKIDNFNDAKDYFVNHGKMTRPRFFSFIGSLTLKKGIVINDTKEIFDYSDIASTIKQLEPEKGEDELKDYFINKGYITRQSIIPYLINQSDAFNEAEIHVIVGNRKIDKYTFKKFVSFISQIQMRELFKLVDKDNSGFITMIEMMNFLKANTAQKWSFQEVSQKMMKGDKNGDGRISFEEFVDMMNHESRMKERMIELFKEFDIDGDGSITKEEFKEILFNMDEGFTEDDVDELMKSGDKDGDNTINFEEFISMIDWDD